MKRLEVRCCCNPDKLYGTVLCGVEHPGPVTFMLTDGTRLELEAAVFNRYAAPLYPVHSYLAIKANHAAIEQLERIASFEPWSK